MVTRQLFLNLFAEAGSRSIQPAHIQREQHIPVEFTTWFSVDEKVDIRRYLLMASSFRKKSQALNSSLHIYSEKNLRRSGLGLVLTSTVCYHFVEAGARSIQPGTEHIVR